MTYDDLAPQLVEKMLWNFVMPIEERDWWTSIYRICVTKYVLTPSLTQREIKKFIYYYIIDVSLIAFIDSKLLIFFW